jgi:hypothetical protein
LERALGRTGICSRTDARQTAFFIGRIRGGLSLKELGQLAGGIHHNAVGIAIRRFTERSHKKMPDQRQTMLWSGIECC